MPLFYNPRTNKKFYFVNIPGNNNDAINIADGIKEKAWTDRLFSTIF